METWKTIPGFSRYQVSDAGQIRSLNYKNSGKVQILKPAPSPGGYLMTMLQTDNCDYKTVPVHRFVAFAFLGMRPAGKEINHKDGNKLNNHIENLEYVTHSQNTKHSFDMGLQIPLRGEEIGNHKLTEQQVREIRDHAKNFKGRYYGRAALAEKYGVSICHIKEIVTRRRNIWSMV